MHEHPEAIQSPDLARDVEPAITAALDERTTAAVIARAQLPTGWQRAALDAGVDRAPDAPRARPRR